MTGLDRTHSLMHEYTEISIGNPEIKWWQKRWKNFHERGGDPAGTGVHGSRSKSAFGGRQKSTDTGKPPIAMEYLATVL